MIVAAGGGALSIPIAEAAYEEHLKRSGGGAIGRSELDTVAAHVEALGGKLRMVADFGGEFYVLG